MKIEHIHIDHFGKLSDADFRFSGESAFLLHENSWGKTTLAVFIKVMLFGFSGENKTDELENERKRYMPWNGGAYGGYLEFSEGGKKYRLERSFGSKKNRSEDRFALYDAETQLESQDFSERIGEEIFQIDRESFIHTMYFGQDDRRALATSVISERLAGGAAEDILLGRYDYAMERLKKERDYLNPHRKTGELYKLHRRMQEFEAEFAKRDRLLEKKQQLDQKIADLKEKKRELLDRGFMAENDRKKNKGRRIVQILRENTPASWHAFFHEALDNDSKKYHIGGQEKFSAEGFVNTARDLGIMGIAMFLLLIAIQFFFRIEELNAETFRTLFVLSIILTIGLYLILRYVIYRHVQISTEDAENEGDENISEELDRCMDEIVEGSKENASLVQEMARIDQMDEAYEEMAERLENLERQYMDFTDTAYYLEKAKLAVTGKFMHPIKRIFNRYYEILVQQGFCDYAAEDFILDAQLRLWIRSTGGMREIGYLSEGYRDLVAVCLRLAMIEAMYPQELPPLILDDPFVNLDEAKLRGAFAFLEELQTGYQLIYFTCHESRMPKTGNGSALQRF